MSYETPMLSFLLACLVNVGPAVRTPIDVERQQLYGWFDSLGFEGFKSGKFVTVYLSNHEGPFEQSEGTRQGFLLEGSGRRFSVLTLDLTRIAFPPKAVRHQQYDGGRFEPADLAAWLRAARKSEYSSTGLAPIAEAFVLSRLAD